MPLVRIPRCIPENVLDYLDYTIGPNRVSIPYVRIYDTENEEKVGMDSFAEVVI